MSTGATDPACQRCRLAATRTRVVPGLGSSSSRIMFVGEAPGRDEDLSGRPFVGRAGSILTQTLEELGIAREDVYINTVKCRPPGNRKPRLDEVDACRQHLEAEFEAVGPEIVCILGLTAAHGLLDSGGTMAELLGSERRVRVGDREYLAVVDYHPAACLYRKENITAFKSVIRSCLEKVGMV
jgi:uracil-DNA glycosylase family 4